MHSGEGLGGGGGGVTNVLIVFFFSSSSSSSSFYDSIYEGVYELAEKFVAQLVG